MVKPIGHGGWGIVLGEGGGVLCPGNGSTGSNVIMRAVKDRQTKKFCNSRLYPVPLSTNNDVWKFNKKTEWLTLYGVTYRPSGMTSPVLNSKHYIIITHAHAHTRTHTQKHTREKITSILLISSKHPSTQLCSPGKETPTSDHIRSHPITSDHTPSHPITPHHTRSHPITSDHIRSHPITSDHIRSHPITSDHIRWVWARSKVQHNASMFLLKRVGYFIEAVGISINY